jgi:small subunit ribosomal protein S6
MKNYEIVAAFRVKENQYETGLKALKELFIKHKMKITAEKDMGDRDLAYPVKKEERGHYHLVNFQAAPDGILKLDSDIKLLKEVLKYLIVKTDKD